MLLAMVGQWGRELLRQMGPDGHMGMGLRALVEG
jgi:hypothetical protein